MKRSLFLILALLAAAPASAQDWAKERLDKSPRRMEWVKVKNGAREVQSFIVFPQGENKTTAVVLIHEIFGLSDWVRSVADQLAEAGYVAIAPDLLSGMAPNGGGTADFSDSGAVGRAINALPPDQITADLNAVADHVAKLPAGNGKVVVAGFCWGGGEAFRFATNNPNLKAAFVFYGTGPTGEADITRIAAPVYGFYAENDARVNATIPDSVALMEKTGKKYEFVIYAGAGHGFMRAGEAPDAGEANKKARDEAWQRWKDLLLKV